MKKTHIIILVVMIVAIAVVIGIIRDSDTYSDFDKAKRNPNETFQIIGKLDKTTEIKYDSILPNQSLSFYLIDDKGNECKVIYYGVKPFNFEKLQQVAVTGKIDDGVFKASEMLLKCPSKYTNNKEGLDKFSPNQK